MKRKGYHIKFTDKEYSRRGIVSLVLSGLSLLWLIFAVFQAFRLGEDAGNLFGGLGTLALVLQIFALVFGIHSLREKNVFRGIPKAAAAAALVMLLIWTAIYGLGIVNTIV